MRLEPKLAGIDTERVEESQQIVDSFRLVVI
jgi:hypothetical protein